MPFMPFAATIGSALGGSATLGGLATAATLGAVGTGIAGSMADREASRRSTRAQEEALAAQAAEKAKLEKEAAEAPEKARLAELDRRRKRVKTLLTSQEDTGMATVGTKVLLGG